MIVVRAKVLNSNDQWRESRQLDKSMMDMATRSHSESVQELLVELLNENNKEVEEAHLSARGQELKDHAVSGDALDPDNVFNVDVEGDTIMARTVPDDNDLNTGTLTEEQCETASIDLERSCLYGRFRCG